MVLGKHSGLRAVVTALRDQGFDVTPEQAKVILAQVKAYAQCTKGAVPTAMLTSFYRQADESLKTATARRTPDLAILAS